MANPTFETILYRRRRRIATITLNRPERLNAFTTQMMLDMIAAFDATDADDGVRAVIVTGAGRGFCAGADLWPAGQRPSTARGATRSGSRPGRRSRTRRRRARHLAHLR
jgi:enoyl-CoA hydratase/carnithine racemase